METILVTRHPAAIAWLQEFHSRKVDGVRVVAEATTEDVRGNVVIGNIPLYLAAQAYCVWAIQFRGPPPRGQEYTVDDMVAAGAHLAGYQVKLYNPSILTDDEEDSSSWAMKDKNN